METLLLAIASMLLVMLIVQFLPIGFTKRGKIVVVITSFFLSLIGISALPSFSLWKVSLMLIVLIFFTAYLMSTRFGHFLFTDHHSFGEKLLDQEESYIDFNTITNDHEQFRLFRNEAASTVQSDENNEVLDTGLFYSHHETVQEVEKVEAVHDGMEDDITFLLNRSFDIEEAKSTEEVQTDIEYISDIESLLLEESREALTYESEELSQKLEDADELPILSFDRIPLADKEQTETVNPLAELEEIPLLTFEDDDFEKVAESKEKIAVKS